MAAPSEPPTNGLTDDELLEAFANNFYAVAGCQGRIAFALMSIHAVNPSIFARAAPYVNLDQLLFRNMLYGLGVLIYGRPNMKPIGIINRLSFSVLSSLAICYSSTYFYDYINMRLQNQQTFLTIVGFLMGRVFIFNLLAYLYHIDRTDSSTPPQRHYDVIIYQNSKACESESEECIIPRK